MMKPWSESRVTLALFSLATREYKAPKYARRMSTLTTPKDWPAVL